MLCLYFAFSVLFIFMEIFYLFEFAMDTTYYRRTDFYAEGPISISIGQFISNALFLMLLELRNAH